MKFYLRALQIVIALSLVPFSALSANLCLDLFSINEPRVFSQSPSMEFQEISSDVIAKTKISENTLEMVTLLKKLYRVQDSLVATVDSKKIKTVVYPSAGYDAAAAFIVFPHAENVIAIDDHPFYSASPQTSEASLERRTDFTTAGAVSQASEGQGVLPALVARLEVSFPEFRLLKIVNVVEAKEISHGWVEFDLGEGTSVRRYIHVSHMISRRGVSEAVAAIVENGIDGLLIKGAMGAMNPDNVEGRLILDTVKSAGGVIVDADGATMESEVAVVRASGAHVEHWRYPGLARDYQLTGTGVNMGYEAGRRENSGLGVKIIKYKPSNEKRR